MIVPTIPEIFGSISLSQPLDHSRHSLVFTGIRFISYPFSPSPAHSRLWGTPHLQSAVSAQSQSQLQLHLTYPHLSTAFSSPFSRIFPAHYPHGISCGNSSAAEWNFPAFCWHLQRRMRVNTDQFVGCFSPRLNRLLRWLSQSLSLFSFSSS